MRKTLALLVVCLGAWALVPVLAQQPGSPGEQRRGNQDPPRFHRHGPNRIDNHYIVVLDEDAAGPEGDFGAASARAEQVIQRTPAGRITHVYAYAINGFAAQMTEEEAIALSEDPDVRFVEEDSVVEVSATQNNPPWGLDRIDERDRPLSGTYSYTRTGSGVNVYVIDTGIRRTHTQFGGRAFVGFDAIGDGRNTSDCNGHGTHVAGTVGGSTYGVAKAVRLYAVRVLNCSGSGTNSGVIAGVDWVTRNRIRPAVANMSLGGGASSALDTAVRNSIIAGVTYVVAAGNSNANAANYSPARVGEAITVGSTTSTDARSSFSNYGSVVDIFAPGSSITSAWYSGDTATRTISGTSMASPHTAGVAARYLQGNTGASPATVRNAIVSAATLNRLTGILTGTANRLLFWSSTQ
jgi:subtilisin family serine protease